MALQIGLISCTKSKTSYPAPARVLYSESDLFRKALAYVEPDADQVYILSALYGLVTLDQVLEPYELTLKSMSPRERAAWAERVFRQIRQRHGDDLTGLTFHFHTGVEYRDHLTSLLTRAGAQCTCPVEGLAIGERLRFYGGNAPARPASPARAKSQPVTGGGQHPAPTGFEPVWSRIVAHAGQPFYQVRSGEFRYQLIGDRTLRLDRTPQNLTYAELEKAFALMPVANTRPLQHLRAPSYIYAILMDARIRQSDW